MTATTVTARDEIRAAAAAHGWQHVAKGVCYDRFIRPATVTDAKLARVLEVSGHAPYDMVGAHYDDTGRVTDASYAGPGAQSVLTGVHTFPHDVPARGKRQSVLALLTDGLPS